MEPQILSSVSFASNIYVSLWTFSSFSPLCEIS